MTSHRYAALTALIDDRQAACGTTTVVAVDGPSGAGKTGLTDQLAGLTGAVVLHFDDVYPGWDGLAETPPMVARGVLDAIAADRVGEVHRWNWTHSRPGAVLHVPPARLLILDGVGSGAAIIRPFLSLLIWVEAPTDVRKARALARDAGAYEPYWDVWAEQERRHFASEETRQHADVIVST